MRIKEIARQKIARILDQLFWGHKSGHTMQVKVTVKLKNIQLIPVLNLFLH